MSDGQLDSATVKFDAVQFAVSYSLRLLRCTGTEASTCTEEAGSKPSETAAGLHTFSAVSTPGLYVIAVTATAANDVVSEVATTPILLVGKPGKVGPAAGPAVAPGVGNATFSWEAPAVNPDPTGVVDATRYTLRIYGTDGTTLLTTQALSGLGGEGTSAAPFTKLVTLIAGERLEVVGGVNPPKRGWGRRISVVFERDHHICICCVPFACPQASGRPPLPPPTSTARARSRSCRPSLRSE